MCVQDAAHDHLLLSVDRGCPRRWGYAGVGEIHGQMGVTIAVMIGVALLGGGLHLNVATVDALAGPPLTEEAEVESSTAPYALNEEA